MALGMDRRSGIVVALAVGITIVVVTVTLVLYIRQRPGECPDPDESTGDTPKHAGDTSTRTGDTPTRHCGSGAPYKAGTYISSDAWFRFGSVASDNDQCSRVGNEFLGRLGGSVVDVAIATLLCIGVVNSQHIGVGGGDIFIIYERPRNGTKKELTTITGRETAPLSAHAHMFDNDLASFKKGPKSMAVPGEINGFYDAWERFGRLPWATLFEPAIKMCKEGWSVSHSNEISIKKHEQTIRNDKTLRERYVKDDDTLYKEGDKMTNPKLARTLKAIAEGGAKEFYFGDLAKKMVADIQEAGGNFTMADFADNKAFWADALTVVLDNGKYKVHAAPPPSSGVVVQFILKVMDGYNLQAGSFNTNEQKTLFFHRVIETWKFAFGRRPHLSDFTFDKDKKWLTKLQNAKYAENIRRKIKDDGVSPRQFYQIDQDDKTENTGGTSHLAVLAPDGAAVSVTSTVGGLFGCKIMGRRTGVIFNDMMNLFTLPGNGNVSANYIVPSKRGRSSTSPMMFRDKDGKVVLLAGGSGSARIMTATSLVAMLYLWMGLDLADATNHPRVHHQRGTEIYYDEQMPEDVLNGLKEKGHTNFVTTHPRYPYLAVVQSIGGKTCLKCRPTDSFKSCVHAVSDYRKRGIPDGY